MVSQNTKGYLCIVGGFLTHLVTGAFYFWGNISINVSSYFRYNGYPNIETSTVSAVFPSIYFGIAIGCLLGTPVARKFGHKKVSIVNMILYCGSMYIATFCNFYLFVLFQGFIPGIFIGIEYLIPVENAQPYFKKQKGLLYGLILCGFGFTPLVFNPIVQYLLNPNNIYPTDHYYPEDVANRLPFALRMITTLYLIIGLTGTLLMQTSKSNKTIVQDSEVDESLVQQQQIEEQQIQIESTKDIFKYAEFYLSLFQIFCLTGFGFLMVSHYKEFGLYHIQDDSYFSMVGQIGGIANGLSRFIWSFLLDYINDKYLILVNISIATFLSSTMNMIADSKILFLIWIVLTYLQYGGVYTLFPGICNKQFGTKYGPQAFSMAFNSIPFSNLLQFLLTYNFQQQFYDGQLFYIYVGINASCFLVQGLTIIKGKYQLNYNNQQYIELETLHEERMRAIQFNVNVLF